MTPTGNTANWEASAACLSADPDLFFPVSTAGPGDKTIVRAKRICGGCAVRAECLDFALAHDQVYGIWGGTTVEERRRDRRRRRRRAATAAARKRTVAA
jgi:WhiB family transcriptional regulator, redox-sensing transcriptional regulator